MPLLDANGLISVVNEPETIEPVTTVFRSDRTRISKPSGFAPPPDEPVTGEMGAAQPEPVNEPEPGFFERAADWYKETDERVTTSIADKLNVSTKTVNTVGLISLIGTGAGLLANGVKSLFDGTLKEKRAERKAEKAAKKQAKLAEAVKAVYPGNDITATVTPTGGPPAAGDKFDIGAFLQKNWMYILGAFILLGGGGLLKKKPVRRRRRSPARVRTVYRTRTRKPASRRRRR